MDPAVALSAYSRQGDCWIWQHAKTQAGYGVARIFGAVVYMHRVSYEYHKGPLPSDAELDHLCRNRACMNPDHLELVSHQENCIRGETGARSSKRIRVDQTKCGAGIHDWTPANIYIEKTGDKHCYPCHLKRVRARKERERAARKEKNAREDSQALHYGHGR